MKIAVLAGGLSPERDVSLTSGALIASALTRREHIVALADLYFDIEGDPNGMFREKTDFAYTINDTAPDLGALRAERSRRRLAAGKKDNDALIGSGIIPLCTAADVTFLALHGASGENGQLQAALECFGIRYTGSDYAGSLLAMDKELSKQLMRAAGITTADWVALDASDTSAAECIKREIGIPCVVKPAGCGSSVGVSIVRDENSLGDALSAAAVYRQRIIAEKLIRGREFSVGVLGGRALPAIEIIPKTGFYDYKNKYQNGLTDEICPASLTRAQHMTIGRAAEDVHRALRLGSYSRSDFILSEDDGLFYCLEANTLPGMTPHSLLPQEAAAAGICYDELCERIALSALENAE